MFKPEFFSQYFSRCYNEKFIFNRTSVLCRKCHKRLHSNHSKWNQSTEQFLLRRFVRNAINALNPFVHEFLIFRIFEDNFNNLDQEKWLHAGTMSGGGNEEFQWYVNDRANSYTTGGNLHIKPTFTSDIFGEGFLSSGRVIIPEWECTEEWNYGCDRTGGYDHIINPIRSARIDSSRSFAFKYGTLEIRAKMPLGDWLWPALWMMPKDSVYGQWPRSGEIVSC